MFTHAGVKVTNGTSRIANWSLEIRLVALPCRYLQSRGLNVTNATSAVVSRKV